jgi:DNA-binding NarL/FixJ family response regulator
MIDGRERFISACRKALSTESDILIVADTTGPVTNGEIATAIADRRPRILLIDIALLRESRYSQLTLLRYLSPGTRCIMLCEQATESDILDALSHGVMGYLDVVDIDRFLAKSVRVVSTGEAWVPRHITSAIAKRLVELSPLVPNSLRVRRSTTPLPFQL